MLVKYVRDFERRPFACVVATESGIGYSVCHDRDCFNKKLARKIAEGRAHFNFCLTDKIGNSHVLCEDMEFRTKRELVREAVERMRVRAEKYWRS